MKKLARTERLVFSAVALAWTALVLWMTRGLDMHTTLGLILAAVIGFEVHADYQQFQECCRAARFRKALWRKISNDSDLHPAFQSEWEDDSP